MSNKKSFKEKYSLHLKIAMFMVIVGIAFSGIGAAAGGFRAVDEGEITDFSYTISSEIDNITLDVSIGNIEVKTSDVFKLVFTECDYNKSENLITESYGNNLSITNKYNNYRFGGLTFGEYFLSYNGFHRYYTPKYVLYVPQEKLKDLTIKNKFGETVIDNITLQNLNVQNELGTIKIENISVVNYAEIDNHMGDNTIKNSDFNNLILTSNMGSVRFKGKISDRADFSLSMGSLELTLLGHSVDDYNFNTEVSMGSLTVNGNHPARYRTGNTGHIDINVQCNMGSVNINTPE